MILEYIQNLFTLQVGLGLLVGVVGGLVIGILPGLGATMAVSLLIPATFGMEPVAALIMLTSIYTAATYGGSMSAILLHTPGTPSSAATALNGYELTKQGRGLEAIGMSTVSSLFGGVFGGIALLVIAPPLSRVALRFSSPEYFFIALFGITIIGSLAGKDKIRGYASGVFGILVGTVGIEQSTAYVRFTFGNPYLQNGISLVPALIGLFSLSQLFIQAERLSIKGSMDKGQMTESSIVMSGKFLPTFKELLSYIPLMLRASILGLLVGILPGAGGDIGSWVGYNEALRSSKNKQLFEHGSLEGICGSESANNAVCGGAYIPLFTLGIPGSAAAAVLMGGLMIHGLQPGFSMFTTNAHITYPIIFGYILANILMVIVGGLCAKYTAKIAAVPMNIITPLIIVLSIIGSYAVNISMFDVYVMIAFGLIGYFMRKSNFPTAPAVLALILGPMAEKSLYSALQMTKGKPVLLFFATRPLCVLFFVLTVLSIFAPTIISYFKKKTITTVNEGTSVLDD